MRWIEDIRDKFGERMDICVDCWGRFDLASAQRIAKAPELPGIGAGIKPELFSNGDAIVTTVG